MQKVKEFFGGLYSYFKPPGPIVFLVASEKMNGEDKQHLEEFVTMPHYYSFKKLVNSYIADLNEELISGKDTRDRMDELAELLMGLDNILQELNASDPS